MTRASNYRFSQYPQILSPALAWIRLPSCSSPIPHAPCPSDGTHIRSRFHPSMSQLFPSVQGYYLAAAIVIGVFSHVTLDLRFGPIPRHDFVAVVIANERVRVIRGRSFYKVYLCNRLHIFYPFFSVIKKSGVKDLSNNRKIASGPVFIGLAVPGCVVLQSSRWPIAQLPTFPSLQTMYS